MLTSEKNVKSGVDFLPINGTDHIEFYVGNAKQAAYFYQIAFGFKLVAYAGPETGVKEKASYVLQQGKLRFVFTTSLNSNSEIAKHVHKHGDGVKVLALWVDDAHKSYEETVKRGAESVQAPHSITDADGEVVMSSIKTYGDTIHTFVERKNYNGAFLPHFVGKEPLMKVKDVGLKYVDHCVGNVELGEMDQWVKFYEDVMGFKLLLTFDDNDISTEYTALMSKVVSNGNGYVKFPINEPADGKRKSQIEEYLEFYNGSGVQHIAVATDDICYTVSELRKRGIEFLYVPDNYYDDLKERVGNIDEEIDQLKELNILVDRDEEGYLLQIFTKPVEDRPTLFFEIIQRKGAKSFGKGNFKALFEAIEREQALRGNL
ncbi:4-hydroxyphenylpyruvate dioxygenase [Flammeovirga yaeyamensis]|uniref:4-hydroxyphenylpyruvate dioxygenase n=1 Tax=Flammeovirga yaeyamensis TaxID=367791 RepID=A0AAX1N7V3_9BACT|nr:4-hydroxyphenylpyruvate dioxygenase [Flammeovirga yaeyamensis]MBB3699009.1 4-hydroxyphenylpyruvate dioxygenase [Flammeovirga yaeyamensis]NMF36443.1 4-hydroxyphenylpyruvate dioxygenase [Flammeovirga yaeyamensis]QWG03598.1 4-hydroxyphenylpyruvate dioxygenase [Flammeovirga yaeyamensis]